jgi:hypothetical protein
MEEELVFYVQGSATEPYKVTFRRKGNNISAQCTCQAGENGLHCKHRVGILGGSRDGIVSGNEEEVKVVMSWLPGTIIEAAIKAFVEADRQCEESKRALSAAKKRLAIAFRG